MGEVSTVGIDLAKSVFQVHGSDARGAVVLRKKLRRDQVVTFFSTLPRCVVAMEACASAHYWAREISAVGHDTRLIPPAYVKPFVKRQKNDMADAEAICEAAQRPTMRFVQGKSAEAQASAVVFRTRDLLVRQRTQLIMPCVGTSRSSGTSCAKVSGTSSSSSRLSVTHIRRSSAGTTGADSHRAEPAGASGADRSAGPRDCQPGKG